MTGVQTCALPISDGPVQEGSVDDLQGKMSQHTTSADGGKVNQDELNAIAELKRKEAQGKLAA